MQYVVNKTITKESFFDTVEAGTEEEAIEKVKSLIPSTTNVQIKYHIFNAEPSKKSPSSSV